MLAEDKLKDLLSRQDVSIRDKFLLCLAVGPLGPRAVKDIRALASNNGFRKAKDAKCNVSNYLRSSGGLSILTDNGWELTSPGLVHVQKLAGPLISSPIPIVASGLRAALAKITDADTSSFVEEAVICFETRQYRAAVVLSWVGAIAVLQLHVVSDPVRLTAFNTQAISRFGTGKKPYVAAKTADDLGQLKEKDFLLVLEDISVIGKNVKLQLESCLTLRNACGHPNSYKLGEHTVAAHVEQLILNVFSAF